MAKPIAVLYLPRNDYYGSNLMISQLTAAFNGYDDKLTMPQGFSDYLWFIFVNTELYTPELEVFHEKDYTEIQYAELKAMLEESIISLKNQNNEMDNR